MSQPSADAKAVVRAVEAMTTQVRRIADALSTPVVRYEVAADDDATTPPTTCGASAVTSFGPVGPCTLRVGHEGPVHKAGLSTFWRDEQAPAADEDAHRADRRASTRNLLARLDRGGLLSPGDSTLLRQHVEAETREHDTMRAVAAGNKRHVQIMYTDLSQAQERARQAEELLGVAHETSNRSEAERAEEERLRLALAAERDRWKERAERAQQGHDQRAAVLSEVLATFVHTVPGYRVARVRSGEVDVVTLEKWRSVLAPVVDPPWWQQVDTMRADVKEAQAAIERVRAIKKAPQRSQFNTLANAQDNGWDAALYAVNEALDGTEQPTTTQRPCQTCGHPADWHDPYEGCVGPNGIGGLGAEDCSCGKAHQPDA
jgi:hypothetical protein